MQILRTVVWTLIIAIVGLFVSMNWGEPQDVLFWPGGEGSRLLFEWPIGFIALFFFVLGFLPMWLLNRATKWRLTRRIGHLEQATRNVATRRPEQAAPAPATDTAAAQTTDPKLQSE